MAFLEVDLTHKVQRAVVVTLFQEDFLEESYCLFEVILLFFLVLVEVQFAKTKVYNHRVWVNLARCLQELGCVLVVAVAEVQVAQVNQ